MLRASYLGKDSFDQDTINSLQNLIKSTSIDLSQKRFKNKKESTRYQNIDNDQYNLPKNKIRLVQSHQNLML